MITDLVNLRDLVEKTPAADRRMEEKVGTLAGAAYTKKDPSWRTPRNGYRDGKWETRAGNVELDIQKRRKGSNFPGLLEPRWKAETALTAMIEEDPVHKPHFFSRSP
jgi:transposase-like protein